MSEQLEKEFPEKQLFQSIIEEIVDDIYVISKENYEILHVKRLKDPRGAEQLLGQKCYRIFYGKTEPCEFCSRDSKEPCENAGEKIYEKDGRFFATQFREIDWNGIPSYVKFVRDVTEEENSRKQKERLEQYFQTVVKYLPGGMAVVHHEVGGALKPEYLSDGFSEMLDMSKEDAWKMYQENALSGVHPEDRAYVRENSSIG